MRTVLQWFEHLLQIPPQLELDDEYLIEAVICSKCRLPNWWHHTRPLGCKYCGHEFNYDCSQEKTTTAQT